MKDNNMINSTQYIKDTAREFSVYTAQSRAIPSVCDGFKDGQRKIMWILRNKSDKIKTVSLAGALIESNLYNHGDASAADTISHLAGFHVNNVPLIEGIGNFGTKVAPNEFGAPRYTYVKRNSVSQDLVYPDLDIVPLRENYDGSNVEPVHFLPLIPLVLLNGISGIAVGWSTDILPHRLSDIVDATITALDGKKIKKLEPYYQYADCKVENIEGNSWEFIGNVTKTDASTVKITELPPGLTLDKFRSHLNKLEEEGKINSYIDKSTKVIDVVIKFPRGSIKDMPENKIVDLLKLRKKQTERIVVLSWNNTSISYYDTVEDLIKDFVEWRLGWYTKRYEKFIKDDSYEKIFWEGVKLCFEKKLPSKISTKKNKKELEDEVRKITSNLKISDEQVDKISSLPSYKWAQDHYQSVLDTIAKLESSIKDYEKILKDPKLLKEVYKTELKTLKSKKI